MGLQLATESSEDATFSLNENHEPPFLPGGIFAEHSPSWKLAGDGMQIALHEGDGSAGAGARVDTVLDVHAEIFVAFVFFRGHELDAHFFGAARNRFFKLEIAGFRDGRVSKLFEDGGELQRLLAQGQNIEKEVDIFRPARFFDHELHGLGPGHDKVIRCRPKGIQ
jgi:hypothetical protein